MGRSAIFLVMGFTLVFLMTGRNLSTVSTEAFKTAIGYYESTSIHNIAEAGANFACNQIFLAGSWRTGYSNIPFGGGTFSVTVTPVSGTNNLKVVSTANYDGSTYSIKILLQPSSFAKFAFWGGTSASAASWETGDTITGPMHVEGKLKTFGQPVFQGKVTTKSGLTASGSPAKPLFNGGYETGVSVPLPTTAFSTLDSIAANGGYRQVGTDLHLTFLNNGKVTWKTSPTGAETTVDLSAFAPNGLIEVDKANIYVQGTVKGRASIFANKSSGSTGGQVFIQNDLVYDSDPRVDPSSTDMLGIISKGDIQIQDNGAALFNVMASMYSEGGGLSVENGTSRPPGTLTVVGGMIVNTIYSTSNGASGNNKKGYNVSLQFDQRFLVTSPPQFPTTGNYEILSWLE